MTSSRMAELAKYAACDISDALLELGVPGAGFLADIVPLGTAAKVIAPAMTVLFAPRSSNSFPLDFARLNCATSELNDTRKVPSNITAGAIYSDHIKPNTIVVLSQPKGSKTATMGSVHALRISKLGAKGVLVDGRVRDVKYLKEDLDIPVWSKSTSIVATRGECKAHAIDVPVDVGGVTVSPGDILMLDPFDNGAVCVPQDELDRVLELVAKLAAAEENTMAGIQKGLTVQEASKTYSTR